MTVIIDKIIEMQQYIISLKMLGYLVEIIDYISHFI